MRVRIPKPGDWIIVCYGQGRKVYLGPNTTWVEGMDKPLVTFEEQEPATRLANLIPKGTPVKIFAVRA